MRYLPQALSCASPSSLQGREVPVLAVGRSAPLPATAKTCPSAAIVLPVLRSACSHMAPAGRTRWQQVQSLMQVRLLQYAFGQDTHVYVFSDLFHMHLENLDGLWLPLQAVCLGQLQRPDACRLGCLWCQVAVQPASRLGLLRSVRQSGCLHRCMAAPLPLYALCLLADHRQERFHRPASS